MKIKFTYASTSDILFVLIDNIHKFSIVRHTNVRHGCWGAYSSRFKGGKKYFYTLKDAKKALLCHIELTYGELVS